MADGDRLPDRAAEGREAQAGEGPMRPPRAVAPAAAQSQWPPKQKDRPKAVSLIAAVGCGGPIGDLARPSSSSEVMRDAKYCDAGQDQKRHCASYAAP